MDEFTIKLPAHAIRFISEMCEVTRHKLSERVDPVYSLQLDAAYDSLNTIECALPEEVLNPKEKK